MSKSITLAAAPPSSLNMTSSSPSLPGEHVAERFGSPRQVFWFFSLLHVLLWTLGPALLYQSLPKDTLEGITWGMMWQWGYDKHPPLAAWLSAASTTLFATTGWPVFLAAQLCVLLTFWAMWRLAREFLTPWAAVIAVMLLEGTYYYSIASVTLNPNIAMLPTWAMLALCAYRVQVQPSLRGWAWVGAWSALSMLAKYQSGILILALVGAMLSSAQGRRALAHRGLLLAVAVCLLMLAPHILWLVHHQFMPFRYLLGYTGIDIGPNPDPPSASHSATPPALVFFVEQALACLPTVLLWLGFFAPRRDPRPTAAESATFSRKTWLAWAALGPWAILVLVGATMHVEMIARWGIPLFNALGVFLMAWSPGSFSKRRLLTFFSAIALWQALMLAGLWWVVDVRPTRTHQPPYSMADPSKRLAQHVSAEWQSRMQGPLRYVAGDRWLVSAVCAYEDDHPRPFFDFNAAFNPWLDPDDLARHGMAVVYRLRSPDQDKQALADISRRYPGLIDAHVVSLHYESSAELPTVQYWVALVPPQSATPSVTD